jgi:hypothetical protein
MYTVYRAEVLGVAFLYTPLPRCAAHTHTHTALHSLHRYPRPIHHIAVYYFVLVRMVELISDASGATLLAQLGVVCGMWSVVWGLFCAREDYGCSLCLYLYICLSYCAALYWIPLWLRWQEYDMTFEPKRHGRKGVTCHLCLLCMYSVAVALLLFAFTLVDLVFAFVFCCGYCIWCRFSWVGAVKSGLERFVICLMSLGAWPWCRRSSSWLFSGGLDSREFVIGLVLLMF